jgi:hypothetical protein
VVTVLITSSHFYPIYKLFSICARWYEIVTFLAGYKPIFRDEDATCVAYGTYSLKTQDCVNVCMKKDLKAPLAGNGGSSFVSSMFSKLFNSSK